jgi:hypothetical protein
MTPLAVRICLYFPCPTLSPDPALGCYFLGLYDDLKRPIAARFDRWETLRARFGGRDEVAVENGAIVSPK